jgi:hypothetical protein
MRLQRPIVAAVHWLGRRWPVLLRVAPGDRRRRRLRCEPPGNDNGWPAREQLPPLARLFGVPPEMSPREAMLSLHARAVERRR